MRIRIFLEMQWYFNCWLCSHACTQCLRGNIYTSRIWFLLLPSPPFSSALHAFRSYHGCSASILKISFSKVPFHHGVCLLSESKWLITLSFHPLPSIRTCLQPSTSSQMHVLTTSHASLSNYFPHNRTWLKCKLSLELFFKSFLATSRNIFPIYFRMYL